MLLKEDALISNIDTALMTDCGLVAANAQPDIDLTTVRQISHEYGRCILHS